MKRWFNYIARPYRTYFALNIACSILFIVILVENRNKPGPAPPFHTISGVYNLFSNDKYPILSQIKIQSKYKLNSTDVLLHGTQGTAPPTDACMLARSTIHENFTTLAKYGNRKVVTINGTKLAEDKVCDDGDVPIDTWKDPLGCKKNPDWAGVMCQRSLNKISVMCPTFTKSLERGNCTERNSILCCDRLDEYPSFTLSPIYIKGSRYMLYVYLNGLLRNQDTENIRISAAEDVLVNTKDTCTYKNISDIEGVSWTCS